MPKVTKRIVDAIRPDPTGKELFVWDEGDGSLKGFGVRMMPSGVASYLIQYRNGEGRTRRKVIGRVGTLTPDEARKMASDDLKEVARGADPSAERSAAREAPTIEVMCEWYLREAEAGRLLGRNDRPIKPWTLYQDKSRINAHVRPLLGGRRVNGVTQDDIRDFVNAIKSGKTAKARVGRGGKTKGGDGAASRVVGMLRTIFAHAMASHPDRKYIKVNPCDGVKKPADGRQRRFLSLDEIKALGEAMRASVTEGEGATGLAAIRFLLMTGLRRMEALALPWDWVDLKSRCIRFEDTKSGAQLRPIGIDAVKLLEGFPKSKECKWVFPAKRDAANSASDKIENGHYIGLPKALERVCKRARLEGVTVHVLRHSFAATAAELGYSELTIAGLLGHSAPGVTARYAHVPDRALLSAADAVSAQIAAVLDGKKQSAEVVPLRGRA